MTAATHDNHHAAGPVDVPPTDVGPVRRLALVAAVVGLGAFAVLGAVNLSSAGDFGVRDFFFAYLCGYVFWAALPVGAMALLMIAYLTGASWGVVLRRAFQACTRTLPLTAVLFLPVAASLFVADGKQSPYWWADHSWAGPVADVAAAHHLRPEAVEENQHKIRDYLNPAFFLLRAVIYFAVFGGIIYLLNTWARPAETSDDEPSKRKLKGISGPGVIAWALFLTFAITDWVMSVEPTWASSMFPVVFGMNAFVCTFSVSVFSFYFLNAHRADVLGIVKEKFRIDIGSLLLGFTMVWAYASFCQYMLIWAGNLPEESVYYLKRGQNGWQYLAYALMAFHWLLPFVVLLFREVKTNPLTMQWVTGFLLLICSADVVWWLIPSVPHAEGGLYVPMAFAAILGIGGVWGLLFTREQARRPILPANSETRFLAEWGHH